MARLVVVLVFALLVVFLSVLAVADIIVPIILFPFITALGSLTLMLGARCTIAEDLDRLMAGVGGSLGGIAYACLAHAVTESRSPSLEVEVQLRTLGVLLVIGGGLGWLLGRYLWFLPCLAFLGRRGAQR